IWLGEILEQRDGLRRDGLARGACGRNHVGRAVVNELLAGDGIVDRGQSRSGEVAAALCIGGKGGVKVVGIRRARARKREEDRIFAAGLGEGRNVRRAHERKHEAIRSIRRLRLLLAEQGERLCVEVGGVSIPGNGAVGLRGIEAAEVASTTTAASPARPAEAAAPTAKTASAQTTASEGSAESS